MDLHRASTQKDRNRTEEDIPRGAELRAFVSRLSMLLSELERAMNMLPHVDRRGHSACPSDLVQQLYERKQKLEGEVSSHMPTLYNLLCALESEVARCRKNLERIREDSGRLNRQETRDKYLQAERVQELELRRAMDERDAVYVVIKKAEAILKVSRSRRPPESPGEANDEAGDERESREDPARTGSKRSGSDRLGGYLDGLLSASPRQDLGHGPLRRH